MARQNFHAKPALKVYIPDKEKIQFIRTMPVCFTI